MYHLLRGQHKASIYQGLYYSLDKNQESGPGATPEPATEREPEVGAAQESEPQREPATEMEITEPEPVYTVIGEPAIPTEEPDVTTILLDIHPTSFDEETNEPGQDGGPILSTKRRRLAPLGWSLIGVAFVLVGVLVVTLVFPWLETSATVTIVPLTQSVNATFTAHLVPGNADLAHQQIQGRKLARLTMSQSKTVPTTGSGYQPAQTAQGRITLYNALPTAQTIPAGTLLIGQDGVQVTTDTITTIPAANLPTAGQISVGAHATATGPAGNIAALDINGPCCRADVIAKNAAPFSGGQNTRSFQAVSAQDIRGASTALATSLTQDATTAYQTELTDSENLIVPVSCSTQVKTDHPQGSEAEHVTVSISETCQGIAYDAAQMQTLVSQAISRQTQESQTEGYQLDRRSFHLQVIQNDTRPETIRVQARGMLRYKWDERQQRALAVLIAGKSEAQAIAILEQQPGISTVGIQFNGRDTSALPTDPGRIQFIFVAYG